MQSHVFIRPTNFLHLLGSDFASSDYTHENLIFEYYTLYLCSYEGLQIRRIPSRKSWESEVPNIKISPHSKNLPHPQPTYHFAFTFAFRYKIYFIKNFLKLSEFLSFNN